MKRSLAKCIWILPACVALGLVLLLAALSLPASWGPARNAQTAPIILEEGPYPEEVYSRRMLDNYTDSLMLLEAADDGTEGLLDRAINVYYTEERGRSPNATLADQLPPGTVQTQRHSYARYWHGFLVFLRPAYALLGYSAIRGLNLVLQHGLLMAVLLLMAQRRRACLFPFVLTLLFLAPTAIGKSLQYSSVYYLLLLGCLLLLCAQRKLLRGDRLYDMFLLSGVLTAYLDLLTYPSAALTVPLVLVCAEEFDAQRSLRESLRRVSACALLWFVGYAGMWAGKWLLALLYNGSGFVEILLRTIKTRASATNGYHDHVSRGRSLWVNVKMLFNNRHLLLLSAFYVLGQGLCWCSRLRLAETGALRKLLLFALPALICVGWNLLLSNHSTIHCSYTYRTLAPALFSLLTALSLAAESKTREGEPDHG